MSSEFYKLDHVPDGPRAVLLSDRTIGLVVPTSESDVRLYQSKKTLPSNTPGAEVSAPMVLIAGQMLGVLRLIGAGSCETFTPERVDAIPMIVLLSQVALGYASQAGAEWHENRSTTMAKTALETSLRGIVLPSTHGAKSPDSQILTGNLVGQIHHASEGDWRGRLLPSLTTGQMPVIEAFPSMVVSGQQLQATPYLALIYPLQPYMGEDNAFLTAPAERLSLRAAEFGLSTETMQRVFAEGLDGDLIEVVQAASGYGRRQ